MKPPLPLQPETAQPEGRVNGLGDDDQREQSECLQSGYFNASDRSIDCHLAVLLVHAAAHQLQCAKSIAT